MYMCVGTLCPVRKRHAPYLIIQLANFPTMLRTAALTALVAFAAADFNKAALAPLKAFELFANKALDADAHRDIFRRE